MDNAYSLPASSTLEAFLGEAIDRSAFISAYLRARDIPHAIVELAGKRHIVVRFESDAYNPLFRMKTLVAHYDRAPDTPGANDNSAACFQLLLLAQRLARWMTERPAGAMAAHNVRIIFTDGEEAAGTKGVAGQGSFALGEGFRKLKMTEDDVFVFDACGRGDTLIVSTAGIGGTSGGTKRGIFSCLSHGHGARRPEELANRLHSLHDRATELAKKTSRDAWLELCTPYSDNAGFLASGIASQVITVLPHGEAETLVRAMGEGQNAQREIEEAIALNRKVTQGSYLADVIPETWQLMHTKADCARTLTSDAFTLMARFLDTLAAYQETAI